MMNLARSILFLWLLLGSCHADEAAQPVCTSRDDNHQQQQCSLYWAPSSIPNAGWGLYTGIDLTAGNHILPYQDLVVPVQDPYKTLPFRGQQRFLSWLGYIWPQQPHAFYPSETNAFPMIADARHPWDGLNTATGLLWYNQSTGEPLSVFRPGIALLANSATQHNMAESRNQFTAKTHLTAGSELFLNYGADWHEWRTLWQQNQGRDYDTLADYNQFMDYSNLPTEQDKRAQWNPTTRHKDHDNKEMVAEWKGPTIQNNQKQQQQVHDTTHSLEWLQQYGVCVDTVFVKNDAVYTKRAIRKGQIIAPTPVLTLKRQDLLMYQVRSQETTLRNKLDLNQPVGQEELLHYCFGHGQSDLLLLPYAPAVNSIRHSSQPNAQIQWSAGQDEYLKQHAVDVLQRSGQLRMDFVALRDMEEGEEILVDFGSAHAKAQDDHWRHERAVPADFYPQHWLNAVVTYEVDLPPLQPGEIKRLVWKHNGQPVATNAYRVGLPRNFSQHMLEYAKNLGILQLFQDLLYHDILESDDWFVFNATTKHGEWFAQRYMSNAWNFNMHYVAAWSHTARQSFLKAMYQAGFKVALETIGQEFGLYNLTCFHASFMGLSECDDSFTHTDVYATGGMGFNLIFPILTVPNSAPELDIQSDDPNIVIRVNYEYDTAIVMGDWVYHKTSPNDYHDDHQMRVVVGQYCAQVTPENHKQISHIYNGEDPAPFVDHWLDEIHWSRHGEHASFLDEKDN